MQIERVPTGITGFDDLVEGGFAKGSLNLVCGTAGSAKSHFGMKYIYNGARDYKDVGIYLTLEEERDSLIKAAGRFDMDLAAFESEEKLYLVDLGKMRARTKKSEELNRGIVGFDTLASFMKNLLQYSKAKRLVIDSLVSPALYYTNMEELRQEMFRFSIFLRETGTTVVMITESLNAAGDNPRFGIEQFLSDSFISLGLERVRNELRRTLTVRKMRFTKHDTITHPINLSMLGMEVSAEGEVF